MTSLGILGTAVVMLCIGLLAAAVPAASVVLVRPLLARRRLRAAGYIEGALIELSGSALIVQELGWRAARLASEDGSITIISHESLLPVGRIIAGPGEPVPIAIRFVLPATANLDLARTIVLRTVGSSARVSRAGPIRCETVAVSPAEVEFIVHACARDPASRAELLSELKGGIYRWWHAAGIHAIRVT